MLTCYFAMRMIKDKVKRSFSLVSGHSLFEGVYRLNIPLNEIPFGKKKKKKRRKGLFLVSQMKKRWKRPLYRRKL